MIGSSTPFTASGGCASTVEHAAHVAVGVVADAQAPAGAVCSMRAAMLTACATDAVLGVDTAAEQNVARMHAHPHVEAVVAVLRLHLRALFASCLQQREAGAHGALGIVLARFVGAEGCQQVVAGVLQHLAAVTG